MGKEKYATGYRAIDNSVASKEGGERQVSWKSKEAIWWRIHNGHQLPSWTNTIERIESHSKYCSHEWRIPKGLNRDMFSFLPQPAKCTDCVVGYCRQWEVSHICFQFILSTWWKPPHPRPPGIETHRHCTWDGAESSPMKRGCNKLSGFERESCCKVSPYLSFLRDCILYCFGSICGLVNQVKLPWLFRD